jgi:hypothetical protein
VAVAVLERSFQPPQILSLALADLLVEEQEQTLAQPLLDLRTAVVEEEEEHRLVQTAALVAAGL